MQLITITTSNYTLHTSRLIRSFKRQHPEIKVTVFCDECTPRYEIEALGVRCIPLPEITALGVKRAKFTAYSRAAQEGGFIYLDSDVIVLQTLDELIDVTTFTACRDDLRECPHIQDTNFPWKNEPELSGDHYFNSGVFAAPVGFSQFFERLAIEAADDDEWEKFIEKGKLYDNHFLCAKMAQRNLPIRFISEQEYNWQGYRAQDRLVCSVNRNGEIFNTNSTRLLRLVHFAGIPNIDAHLAAIPPEVANVLAKATAPDKLGILELLHATNYVALTLEPRIKSILVQAICASPQQDKFHPGSEVRLLGDYSSCSSIINSTHEANILWNGLKCGSAYLSAEEYDHLRNFVEANKIKSVLEFGAGYTSVLFTRLGCKQIAIEGWKGPWLDFARENGADARHIPFIFGSGFTKTEYQNCLNEFKALPEPKLIFIDSPPGTQNRQKAVEQLLNESVQSNFYALHDSSRDSTVAYHISSKLGLSVVEHHLSFRGLTILAGEPSTTQTLDAPRGSIRERLALAKFSVQLLASENSNNASEKVCVIQLTNTGEQTIYAKSDKLGFSYHLLKANGEVLKWDWPRYWLPTNLKKNDEIVFKIELPYSTTEHSDEIIAFDFVKEGEFWWSDSSKTPSPILNLNP